MAVAVANHCCCKLALGKLDPKSDHRVAWEGLCSSICQSDSLPPREGNMAPEVSGKLGLWLTTSFPIFLKKDFIYLFLERREGREREGEKHRCERETLISCLLHAPNWGPGPQPKHVP